MVLIFIKLLIAMVGVIFTGVKVATYCEAITQRTPFGRAIMGGVFLAGVTSLPELVATVGALKTLDTPNVNLIMGDIFGSNLFNLTIIAGMIFFFPRRNVLNNIPGNTRRTALFSVVMLCIVVAGKLLYPPLSLVLPAFYAFVFYEITRMKKNEEETNEQSLHEKYMVSPMKIIALKTVFYSIGVMVFGLWMVYICDELVRVTGWGSTFVGTIFLALATSTPEIVTTFSSFRLGAGETALGNIFGSNLFNLLLIFVGELLTGNWIYKDTSTAHLFTISSILGVTYLIMSKNKRGLELKKKKYLFAIIIFGIYLLTNYVIFITS